MACKPCNTIDFNTRKPIVKDGCDPDCIGLPHVWDTTGRLIKDIRCDECITLFTNYDTAGGDLGDGYPDLVARCLAKCIVPGSAENGIEETEKQVKETNKKTWAIALVIVILLIAIALIYTL